MIFIGVGLVKLRKTSSNKLWWGRPKTRLLFVKQQKLFDVEEWREKAFECKDQKDILLTCDPLVLFRNDDTSAKRIKKSENHFSGTLLQLPKTSRHRNKLSTILFFCLQYKY